MFHRVYYADSQRFFELFDEYVSKTENKSKPKQIVAGAATQLIRRVIHILCLRLIFEPTDVDVFDLFFFFPLHFVLFIWLFRSSVMLHILIIIVEN